MTSTPRLLEQESPQVHTAEAGRARAEATRTITLGLVPSPGLPEEVARDISDDLAHELAQQIDDSAAWVIRIVPDPITGSDVETPELLKEMDQLAQKDSWDYSIALTDLPVRRDEQIVLAGASTGDSTGWISIPALGPFRLRRRVRKFIVEMVDDLHHGVPDNDEDLTGEKVRRRDPTDANEMIDARYVTSGPLAPIRLLGGMVYANEPWTIFPSFKTTIATAAATGSYSLIFTSIWELGGLYYSPVRLALLALLSISVLSAWVIISHHLWQPRRTASSRFLTATYNATTVATVAAGVIFAYVLIYLVLLAEGAIFMPPSRLEALLQRPPSPPTYLAATVVAASVGTLAGALGAGLEDTERVRRATFSWRMQRRFEEYEAAREEDAGDERDDAGDQ